MDLKVHQQTYRSNCFSGFTLTINQVLEMVHRTNQRHVRLQIAQEAARIILDEGIKDYQHAKRKASERLRVGDRATLPRNTEIEQAIRHHQTLFFTKDDYQHQLTLWRTAQTAMRFLQAFNPRLVGSILHGTAGRHSSVNLHVFADALEEVLILFLNSGVPYQSTERRIRNVSETKPYPMLRYLTADVEIEAIVFPINALRHAPLSTIDGKPMKRAEISEVEKRIEAISTYYEMS